MTNYYIRNTSPLMFFLNVFVVNVIIMGTYYILKINDYIPTLTTLQLAILVLCQFSLVIYLIRSTAIVKMEISLSDQRLRIKWLNQYLFHKIDDYDILFSDIKEYVFENDQNYDVFKLTLKDNSKIKIHQSIFYYNGEFDLFKKDFNEKIIIFNLSNGLNNHSIQEGKTFYETKAAIVVYYVLIAVLIAIPIVIIILQLNWRKPSLLASLGTLYFSSFYFLLLVNQHQKPKQI